MVKGISSSALDLIGNTPLVELSRITKGLRGKILAKVEFFNPGFSKKDRIALQTIEEAEKAGILEPGQAIIELTSGNTGTGYSIVCALKGYKFIAVMSKGNSSERARMMRSFGAEVVLVDQALGSTPGQVSGDDLALVEKEAQKLTKQFDAFRADQFDLDGNWRSHFLNTAEEIINQSNGKIDAFCDFVGSGGSYYGISKKLKEHNNEIKCYVVEPNSVAVLANKPITNANHKIQGGGYSMDNLKFLKDAQIDGYLQITDDEAIEMCRRLAKEEGIFAGFSSGANVAAAMKLLESGEKRTIVCLLCDIGLKYLSTDLWI
ncbi:MAG: PLP-dependent cysteine synthase family protein [Candidatus Kariarchaeaceae archaeon]|jgi:cysteine synthase A